MVGTTCNIKDKAEQSFEQMLTVITVILGIPWCAPVESHIVAIDSICVLMDLK